MISLEICSKISSIPKFLKFLNILVKSGYNSILQNPQKVKIAAKTVHLVHQFNIKIENLTNKRFQLKTRRRISLKKGF